MNKPRTSYPFLLEMLWVCGFFSVAACIFVLAFVKADLTSRDADALNHAVRAAQNAIETRYSTHDPTAISGTEEFYYDRNWNETKEADTKPAYTLRLTDSIKDHMLYVTAEVTDKEGSLVYSLDGARYLTPERGNP